MVFPHSAGLWSEPEGLSPDGGLYTPTNRKTHQAREPRGLSPSGGNSAAKSLFLEYSRAPWARCGVQGVTPCREPRGLSPNGGLNRPTDREPHQSREPRGLSPSGGKTPAKPHVSRVPCAPMARSPGCRGTAPAKPARLASREACRRAVVKPGQAACLPSTLPAFGGQSGVQGVTPCEARRRAAVKPRPSSMSRYAPCPPSAGSPGSRGTAPWGRGGSSRMSLRPKCSRKRSVVA